MKGPHDGRFYNVQLFLGRPGGSERLAGRWGRQRHGGRRGGHQGHGRLCDRSKSDLWSASYGDGSLDSDLLVASFELELSNILFAERVDQLLNFLEVHRIRRSLRVGVRTSQPRRFTST